MTIDAVHPRIGLRSQAEELGGVLEQYFTNVVAHPRVITMGDLGNGRRGQDE
jgi:hypothetical protein